MVIVATLLVMVKLASNGINAIKLNQAATKVVADLRYAQQLATTTRKRHGLTIQSAGGYSVHIDNSGEDAPVADAANIGQRFVVDFDTYQQGELKGVRFRTLTPFCKAPRCSVCRAVMEFNGLGIPSDSEGSPLCSGQIVLTQPGGGEQAIAFEANTGRILN